MCATAANLIDDVLPEIALRQCLVLGQSNSVVTLRDRNCDNGSDSFQFVCERQAVP